MDDRIIFPNVSYVLLLVGLSDNQWTVSSWDAVRLMTVNLPGVSNHICLLLIFIFSGNWWYHLLSLIVVQFLPGLGELASIETSRSHISMSLFTPSAETF